LTTTWQVVSRQWHAFFHQPCDARICAALRVVFSLLVLIHLAVLYPDLDLWFTDQGVLPSDAAEQVARPFAWSLLSFLPPTSTVVHICFWITVTHTVALLVGFFPQLNAFCLFVWLMSFQVRNAILNDGEDTLMRMLAFFLTWVPTSHCLSIHSWLGSRWSRPRVAIGDDATKLNRYAAPGWGLRLVQIEMASMLLSAGLLKLSGDAWFNGTALYYVSRLDDHFGRFPVPDWAFDSPVPVAILTWGVLIAEVAVPVLIWFRETRRPCLIFLLVFHLANEWMMNLFLFHWLMLCGWMAFLDPSDFAWFTRKSRGDVSEEERDAATSAMATDSLAGRI
jgi:hypothetical protein